MSAVVCNRNRNFGQKFQKDIVGIVAVLRSKESAINISFERISNRIKLRSLFSEYSNSCTRWTPKTRERCERVRSLDIANVTVVPPLRVWPPRELLAFVGGNRERARAPKATANPRHIRMREIRSREPLVQPVTNGERGSVRREPTSPNGYEERANPLRNGLRVAEPAYKYGCARNGFLFETGDKVAANQPSKSEKKKKEPVSPRA